MNVGAEALLSLAQFAVALAGFMGVVMVFRRTDAAFHPIDSHRIQVGLAATFGPAFLALIPAGLRLAGVAESGLWRLCSGLGVFFAVGYIGFETLGRRRLPPQARAMLSARVVRVFRALLGLSLVLQAVNLSGIWLEPQPGLYSWRWCSYWCSAPWRSFAPSSCVRRSPPDSEEEVEAAWLCRYPRRACSIAAT